MIIQKLDVKNGVYIGIFTRHRIAENFMIQPEFNYSSKGATRRIVINNNQLDFSVKFDYLEFPVILKYNFGSNYSDKVKPELFFGGFGAFHLRSSVSLDEVPDSDVNISEVKNMDYGILFGTAVGFKIDNVDILLELRYTMSLPSYDNSNSNFDVRHSVFSIGTGFVIN